MGVDSSIKIAFCTLCVFPFHVSINIFFHCTLVLVNTRNRSGFSKIAMNRHSMQRGCIVDIYLVFLFADMF